MFLRSLSLGLCHSGDSLVASMRHKRLSDEEGGWREVSGAAGQAQARCRRLTLPTTAAALVLILAVCHHAGSTPRCCCHEVVSDDYG